MGVSVVPGASQPDAITTQANAQGQIQVKPQQLPSVTFTGSTTLTSDLYCNNCTINNGVTLTTNGYNIYCIGTFDNSAGGTVVTGVQSSGGGAQADSGSGGTANGGGNGGFGLYVQATTIKAGAITTTGGTGGAMNAGYGLGGGGGGGGAGSILLAYSASLVAGTYTQTGGTGGAAHSGVQVAVGETGGAGGSGQGTTGGLGGTNAGGAGGTGNQATGPTITNNLIRTWFTGGFTNYIGGTGGGGGASVNSHAGNAGTNVATTYGGTGGGGGGVVTNTAGNGGTGGAGIIMTYQFTTTPVNVTGWLFTAASGSAFTLSVLAKSTFTAVTWIDGTTPKAVVLATTINQAVSQAIAPSGALTGLITWGL